MTANVSQSFQKLILLTAKPIFIVAFGEGLKCPHKFNFITQCSSACRATCEGVGCCGWESWINSPWLSMSVRAIPIRNQKKMHGWDCIFWLLQHRSSNHWATTIEAMLLLSRYLSSLLHIHDVTREFFCYMA